MGTSIRIPWPTRHMGGRISQDERARMTNYEKRPLPADDGDDGVVEWHRYRRTGTVTAHLLDTDRAWLTSGGDIMSGKRGDWVVEDASGGVRTVAEDKFRATHRHLRDDSWERCAVVEARPARPGERVMSLEGISTAGEGSWVVRDAPDNAWVVPVDHFRRAYAPER